MTYRISFFFSSHWQNWASVACFPSSSTAAELLISEQFEPVSHSAGRFYSVWKQKKNCRYLCKNGFEKSILCICCVYNEDDNNNVWTVCLFLSLHPFICLFLLPGQIYLITSLCSTSS